jgi:hypothetical protein
MNRFLIPAAVAALVAGCAMPGIFRQQSNQPVVADSVQTVVVREIYHETPVYYVDTVYMAEEPAPVQPVYVQETNNEYNEYNEYNETNVYVHEHVVLPPPPRRHERGWSPREHEPRPRDRRRDDGSPRDRNQPRDQEKPKVINPRHPVKKTNAPVTNGHEKSPLPPTQPTPPRRQAPAQGGSAPSTQVQAEAPKQAPTPPADKPGDAQSNVAQVQVGTSQAGTGLQAARGK